MRILANNLCTLEGRRDEVVESLKNDYVELIEKLDYDLFTVELVPPKGYCPEDPPKKIAEGVWEDKRGNIYKYAASNDFIICMCHAKPQESVSEKRVNIQMACLVYHEYSSPFSSSTPCFYMNP